MDTGEAMTDKKQIILESMRVCTIANGYAGLDEFKQFAQEQPDSAVRVAWDILLNRSDPGRDDGALCVELLRTISVVAGQARIEDLILKQWDQLSDPIRKNLTEGAACRDIFSINFAEHLFSLPSTRVDQRHQIVAGLAAGDDRNCDTVIRSMAQRIGSYPDAHRHKILDRFTQDIARNFTK